MGDETAENDREKRCPVCRGRGALRCDCWPGDCICGWDDEDCPMDEDSRHAPVEMKPCPFCGSAAERRTLDADEFGNEGGDVIECSGCRASSHVEFGRKENLLARWNARTSDPSPDGLIAVLSALCDAYAASNGEDHPAYTAAREMLATAEEVAQDG